MRRLLSSVMVAGLMALAGCHTCDVCDDCGDGYDNHYRGCRGCGSRGHYAPGYVVPHASPVTIESKPAAKAPATLPTKPPASSSGS